MLSILVEATVSECMLAMQHVCMMNGVNAMTFIPRLLGNTLRLLVDVVGLYTDMHARCHEVILTVWACF